MPIRLTTPQVTPEDRHDRDAVAQCQMQARVNGTHAVVRGFGRLVLDIELATGPQKSQQGCMSLDLIGTLPTPNCLSS